MDKKKIVFILPRGEAIKNFVYTGISDTLRKSYHLVFLSVIPNQEIKKYLESKCDEFYELREDFSASSYSKEVLNVLQIAHAKDLNSVTGNLKLLKDDVSSRKNLKSKIVRNLRKFFASFYKSKKSLAKLTDYYTRLQYKRKNVVYYEKILKEVQPDIVFNSSHIHNRISLDVVYAAKKLNIKTLTFLFSWDNLTSQGRILPNYDLYISWNEKIKQDLTRIYPHIKSDDVFVTGSPQFDFHFNQDYILSKEELYTELGIDLNKKIVLYSTGMAYYTPKEYKIVEEIQKVLEKVDTDLQLVVRIYAKDDNTPYYDLREKNKKIIVPDHYWELNYLTPTIKDIKLFTSLVHYSCMGMNVASTVSLDLMMHEKPVINIAFNPPNEDIYPNDYLKIYDFDHYKPIVESKAVRLAKSVDELHEVVTAYNNDPSLDDNYRKALIKKFFGEHLKSQKADVLKEVFDSILK